MTAVEFAQLVEARVVGRRRFQARCPAHHDRSPSLSIAEGRDGRVLLHCFAGCGADAILSVLRLSRRDLFQGPPPSPAQLAAIEDRRKALEQRRRVLRRAESEAWDRVRRWGAVVSALGAKLALVPGDAPDENVLTRTFHAACEQLRKVEAAALTASKTRGAA